MQLEAQSIPVIIHYHHGWLIWMLFLSGGIIHAALQIDSISRSHKKNRLTILSSVWIPLLYRVFACAMVFGLIWQHPDLIAKISSMVGHPLNPDEQSVFDIPMNNSIAGLYGLFLDSLLGYIPVLKSQMPIIDTPIATSVTTSNSSDSSIITHPIPPWPEMDSTPIPHTESTEKK